MRSAGAPTATTVSTVIGVATVVAGVVYSAFLLTPLLPTPLDPGRSYVSELAALDQPYGTVFRVVDAVVGLVVVVTGLHLVRRGPLAATRRAGAALGLFGVATVLDVAVPMACAPSGDAACAAADASRSALAVGLHEVSSFASNAAAIVAVMLLALGARGRSRPSFTSGWAAALLMGSVLVAVPGLIVVLEETVGLGLDHVVGYVQRLQVLALSAVLATIGLGVLRGPCPSRTAR